MYCTVFHVGSFTMFMFRCHIKVINWHYLTILLRDAPAALSPETPYFPPCTVYSDVIKSTIVYVVYHGLPPELQNVI